jgi:predicted O-methyltransferase YrrM
MAADRVRSVRERALSSGMVTDTMGRSHDLAPVAIPASEGEALRAWVERERAATTVEVGLGYAMSASYICEGLLAVDGEGRHVAIDPHQASRFADCGLRMLAEAGLDAMVELHRGESQIVLPRLLEEGRRFDLAFVDGDHRFDGVFLDLVYLGRLVRGGGVLFVDDYQLASAEHAVSFCVTNLGWAIEELSRADDDHNWVVLRTPAIPLERSWDHFVPF